MTMNIEVFDRQSSLPIDHEQVKALVLSTLDFIRLMGSTICIHFVEEKESGEIHEQYFNDPSPTDCMTFPIDDEGAANRHLGECIICPKIGIEYGIEHGIDPFEEVSLYIVHTLLHLNNMSDNDEESAKTMREWESLCMNNLRKKNLLLRAK